MCDLTQSSTNSDSEEKLKSNFNPYNLSYKTHKKENNNEEI